MKIITLMLLCLSLTGCWAFNKDPSPLLLDGVETPLAKTTVNIDSAWLVKCPATLTTEMPSSPTKSEVLAVKGEDNKQYVECAIRQNNLVDVLQKVFEKPKSK